MKKLCLPFPSDEELELSLDKQAKEMIPKLSPFFIENWSSGLRSLSIETSFFTLNDQLISDLEKYIDTMMGSKKENPNEFMVWEIAHWAADVLNNFGKGFVRLGSRSPKDNPCFMDRDCRLVPLYSGMQVVEALGYSERIYLDLTDAKRANYYPTICLRRWIDIKPDHEFRCFVENSEIVGITQYYLNEGYSTWINKNSYSIENIIFNYIKNVVLKLTYLTSLTIDVVLDDNMLPTLLEINPPVSWGRTFTGLFKDDFDGSFKFIDCLEK